MLRLFLAIAPLLSMSFSAMAFDEPPNFEVAAIYHHNPIQGSQPIQIDDSQFRAVGSSLQTLIIYAFGVRVSQVSAPEWVRMERYDIWAKLPPGSTKKDIPGMVRTLLAARFRMKAHWTSTEGPVYALLLRGHETKFKRSTEDEPKTITFSSAGYISARAITMLEFCDTIAARVGRPVIDRTGLEGRFNINMELANLDLKPPVQAVSSAANDNPGQQPFSDGSSIFTVLTELGLRLQGTTATTKRLIIDSVDKGFTTN